MTAARIYKWKQPMPINDVTPDLSVNLAALQTEYGSLSLQGKVLHLKALLRDAQRLNIDVIQEMDAVASDARTCILLYLQAHVGIIIDSAELEVVSGISDYPRRIRELRVQFGYKVVSGAGNDPASGLTLRPSQYVLLDAEPDRDAAHRWHTANHIRRLPISGQDKILQYLQANTGRIVTSEELAYVAKISDWPRRVRELRTEEGYAVATRFTGRPDLRSGEYVLESADRVAEPHDRHIPTDVQQAVYARDSNTCRLCGGRIGAWTRPGSYALELHHIQHHAAKGRNLADNLLVLCNACHDDVHAGRLAIP